MTIDLDDLRRKRDALIGPEAAARAELRRSHADELRQLAEECRWHRRIVLTDKQLAALDAAISLLETGM
jgi:hypothetical protein